jgi:uncharacterized membrane protein
VLRSKLIHLIMGICILATLGLGLNAGVALGADPTTTTTTTTTPSAPVLRLTCDVPSYSDNSGATFTYNVVLHYTGDDTINVNFSTVNPNGWSSLLQFSSKEISSLPVGPHPSYSEEDSKTIAVTLSPNSGVYPDPGNYLMTLNATAGQYNVKIDLTAVVKAKYSMTLTPSGGKYNINAITGKENNFTFQVQNTGSATLANTTFSTNAPSGWTISFSPQNIAALSAGSTQQVVATISPPEGKTVAGDYMTYFYCDSGNVHQSMDIRVQVTAPSIWGVVSIIIIVVVVIGLGILFWRLGRR